VSIGLSFADVACVRGGRLLFEGLSFALGPGDAALIIGPNGTGKSSLIRIAARLLPAAAGQVAGDGARALLADTAALDPELGLAAALRFWARIDGRAAAVEDALAAVGLNDLAQVPVRLLSTGQRRRAALARVVASGAPIWLLDEPANGLDSDSVRVLDQLLADHRGGGGIALVATHLPIALPEAREVRL
jgi:heme exporter protein A